MPDAEEESGCGRRGEGRQETTGRLLRGLSAGKPRNGGPTSGLPEWGDCVGDGALGMGKTLWEWVQLAIGAQ